MARRCGVADLATQQYLDQIAELQRRAEKAEAALAAIRAACSLEDLHWLVISQGAENYPKMRALADAIEKSA